MKLTREMLKKLIREAVEDSTVSDFEKSTVAPTTNIADAQALKAVMATMAKKLPDKHNGLSTRLTWKGTQTAAAFERPSKRYLLLHLGTFNSETLKGEGPVFMYDAQKHELFSLDSL